MADQELQAALQEISTIRRIMSQAAAGKDASLSSVNTSIVIHASALVLSLGFLLQELGMSPLASGDVTASSVLQLSAGIYGLRALLVGLLGVFLAILCIALYVILWAAARHDNEQVSAYVARNFRSFAALSFLSDLMVKFCGVAVIIAAGHPEWLSPFLLACIADYLFQGRLFQLPLSSSVVMALGAVALGCWQLYSGAPSLSVALGSFVVVMMASLFRVVARKRAIARHVLAHGGSDE